MKKILSFLTLILLLSISIQAKIFYVSNAGNDNNTGISKENPLKTLQKASENVSPGDAILLRRGDVFRESVEIPVKDIRIDAYGAINDLLPIISGAVQILNFKPYHDGIYVAESKYSPGYLFVDNKLMTIARYPNDDWLRTKYWEDTRIPRDATIEQLEKPNTMVECPELKGFSKNEDDFWIGANIRWRHHSWWYETRQVVDYESVGKLYLNDRSFGVQNPRPGIEKGWGFYLDNKLELIDIPGEWYFDKERKLVYLYSPEGKNPNDMLVEGSVRSFGLKITDGVVQHIKFQHQQNIGLWIDGTSVVQYCEFEGIGRDATVSEHGAGGAALHTDENVGKSLISHNTFRNNLNNSIHWQQNPNDTTSSIIEHNFIQNSGIVRGYGGSGSWHAVAILVRSGRNVHVQYNQIEKSGYAGILFGTDGNFAEYNIIKNAMFTLNDGGGIYTNCSYSTFRYNIIIDTRGGMESSGSWPTIAHGIWPEFLGEYRENIIEYNTIIGSGGDGIFLPNNFDCIVRNNVCYNNDRYQLLIMGKGSRRVADNQHHIITGNILYAAAPFQNTLYFDDRINYGILKDNYLCKPYSDVSIHVGRNWPGGEPRQRLSIKEWQAQFEWADTSPQTDIKKMIDGEKISTEIFINESEQTKIIKLEGSWQNLNGRTVNDSLILEPYTSQILLKK